ncbi:MAG: neutral zinc metallopeptidase, partial [Muribaculaceae bacterium]|nr:neutral zinc metallopeptidase [Muribaculaceae bacterium]
MKLNGRRQSTNVEDRRGQGGGIGLGSIGIGGGVIGIIIAVVIMFMGGDPSAVIGEGGLGSVIQGGGTEQQGEYKPTAEEEELAVFSKQILAGTEDVWTKLFAEMGRTYEPPKLVLFTNSVQSGCGGASSQMGPFYCSADKCVYIDLSFFSDMKKTIGADGDFAYAYVIAHEVGHHVQNLLGTLSDA